MNFPKLPRSHKGEPAEREKPRFRRSFISGLGTLFLAAGILVAAGAVQPPKNLNFVGMIRKIQEHNDRINGENAKIVSNMQQISNLSGTTTGMAQHLGALNQGITADEKSLSALNGLSQQELQLSVAFVHLAQKLHGNMTDISQSSVTQGQSVSTMLSEINQLALSAEKTVKTNQTIASKLTTATKETAVIAKEMP